MVLFSLPYKKVPCSQVWQPACKVPWRKGAPKRLYHKLVLVSSTTKGEEMKRTIVAISIATATTLLWTGCDSSSANGYGSTSTQSQTTQAPQTGLYGTIYTLTPQEQNSTTPTALFFGEVNDKGLGSLKNVQVRGTDINKTIDVRYPVVTTSYTQEANGYTNLAPRKLLFVSNGIAYSVDMSSKNPSLQQQTNETNLTKPSYTKVEYLGERYYLSAQDANGTILITPEMTQKDTPLPLGKKSFVTVTYQTYGDEIDGYLLRNTNTSKLQKCSLDLTQCKEINITVGSRDFKGDIPGTTKALFFSNNTLSIVDKSDGSVAKQPLEPSVARGHGTTALQGKSFYYIGDDHNLYRVDLDTLQTYKITPNPDETLERIRGFTDSWVIYGSDTILKAAKKDGSTSHPILLIETTKTAGYKYVTGYGLGEKYLFVKYALNPSTAHTTYEACIFENGSVQCIPNSFWAAVVLKKDGKRDFEASFTYTPYAIVRVDETDDYAGGTLKAIDPAHPLEDGITLGSIQNYNFQTFLSNYRYKNSLIDSNGSIVLYAKNDVNFHVDAFSMNLLQENSLKQLTNTDPINITKGRDHCHGRVCMICHNLAGGKIYTDKKGTASAYGYRIKLQFENGKELLTDVAKGHGENFSTLIKNLLPGKFNALVLDGNGTVVNRSYGYTHNGVEAANCNYCHARGGKTRFDAPGTISIAP